MLRRKRYFSLFIVMALLLSLIPLNTSVKSVNAEGTKYTRTYTKMVDYDYGEKNKGFYLAPDEPGKYPVIFMFHGAGEKSSSNWEYRSYLMDTVNKWIALGYMDPMVIIVPNIEREDASDNWSCYGFHYYVSKGRFGSLLKKIKNGECEFDDKVDHNSKFSVTGFSMGGVESLFIGTSYKNDILNIGACSPSYMYFHMTGENDDGWIKKPEVNFTGDPNAHLFMGYGTLEAGTFGESVARYIRVYKENKTPEQSDFIVYNTYPDGHTWATFSREIFCFVYYMKFDKLPDDATIERACKDTYLDYGDDNSGGGSNNGDKSKESGNKESEGWKKTADDKWYYVNSEGKKASNEWIDGYWLGDDGILSYTPTGCWKQNEIGWWYEDTSGWYPVNCWQRIDGVWYYFDAAGYMAVDEWIDGYWLSSNGAYEYEYRGEWKLISGKWSYGDASGWSARNCWQRIDGVWYWFDSSGSI